MVDAECRPGPQRQDVGERVDGESAVPAVPESCPVGAAEASGSCRWRPDRTGGRGRNWRSARASLRCTRRRRRRAARRGLRRSPRRRGRGGPVRPDRPRRDRSWRARGAGRSARPPCGASSGRAASASPTERRRRRPAHPRRRAAASAPPIGARRPTASTARRVPARRRAGRSRRRRLRGSRRRWPAPSGRPCCSGTPGVRRSSRRATHRRPPPVRTRRIASVEPLALRLSRLNTVRSPAPPARRSRAASTRWPTTLRGVSGWSTSWRTSGWARSRRRVAGSMQYPFSVTVTETIVVSADARASRTAAPSDGACSARRTDPMIRCVVVVPSTTPSVYRPSCGPSAFGTSSLRRETPMIPRPIETSSWPAASRSSAYTARWARENAPSPRCTMPHRISPRS